jgi:hypothetical protein
VALTLGAGRGLIAGKAILLDDESWLDDEPADQGCKTLAPGAGIALLDTLGAQPGRSPRD